MGGERLNVNPSPGHSVGGPGSSHILSDSFLREASRPIDASSSDDVVTSGGSLYAAASAGRAPLFDHIKHVYDRQRDSDEREKAYS